MKKTKPTAELAMDAPYVGIEDIEGRRPFNGYLWNTWDRWANGGVRYVGEPFRGIYRNFPSAYRFGIVELKDGRFSTDGRCDVIDQGKDYKGLRCVFVSRIEAIRAAAARMLKEARGAQYKNGYFCDRLTDEDLQELVNWTLRIVAEEAHETEPKPVRVLPRKEKLKDQTAGLPLFDASA